MNRMNESLKNINKNWDKIKRLILTALRSKV